MQTQNLESSVTEAQGPRGSFLVGNLPERRRDPIKLYTESVNRYGDIVRFQMGPFPVILLAHPDHIRLVLQERAAQYPKGAIYDVLKLGLGEGLLTSQGDFWRRQRKLAQPAFHRERLTGFGQTMVTETRKMLDRWKDQRLGTQVSQPLDLAQEMMRLTLSIVGLTLFSRDVSGDADAVGAALTRVLHITNERLLSLTPWMYSLPTPKRARFFKDLGVLDRVVYDMIRTRRQDPTDRGDLLSMFMSVRDEETGQGMADQHLRDEIMTIFLAGHETTANALAWTFVLLSQNPWIARKLQDEVRSALGGKDPTFADLPRLAFAERVIQESMRLYPPAWVVARQAAKEDVIGGKRIPKGAFVVLSQYVTHRHPEFWKNPEGFDPDRFLDQNSEGRHKYAYFPFGGGPRVCIGNAFAMMEATLILATIVQQGLPSLVPGARIVPEPMITLRPKYGVPVILPEEFRAP